MDRRNALTALVATALAPRLALAAETFPSRTVKIVVPYGPGGPTDIVARLVADRMAEILRESVIVDNRGGGGGNIGTTLLAKAAPDGYTLGVGTNNTLAANLSVYSSLPFDPLKDFSPIGMIFYAPSMVVVNPKFPAKNVPELVALLKQNPNGYAFGSGGVGASSHFAGELMNKMLNVKMTHVPYKSDAAAINDCIAGSAPIVFCNVSTGMRFHQAGQVRGLGVTSAKRVPVFPDLPAIAETLPGFDLTAWFSLMAPAKTPPEVVARLNAVLAQVLQQPAIEERIVSMGGIPAITKPEDVTALIRAEIPKWGELAKAANIRAD